MKINFSKGISFMILLALCLMLANAIYVRTFYHNEVVEADAKLLFDLDSLEKINDVLYFGESSTVTYSPDDTCIKTINELIQQQAPGIRLGLIDHGAYHAKCYLELIKNIKPDSRVKTIIVTMNLRTFGALWINNSQEASLQKAIVMYLKYPPIVKRMMLALSCFDNRTADERVPLIQDHWKYDKINVPGNFKYQNTFDWDQGHGAAGLDTFPDGKWNLQKLGLACNYIKTFGFSIGPNTNPRVNDFDELVKVAKEKKLNLIFNLMPENVQYADSLGGKELGNLMRDNRNFLMKRYNKDGVIVVDNLELVDGKNFIEQDGNNE
ncbi:MAG TPA: DUF4843 domain-containing protein, partial [Bacteroidia bacterium]|nr:DUF4843 domain-containing protein [Bacteroidia bacterium]